MSAVASNGYFASKENIPQGGSKVTSPASPLLQSSGQMAARSLMNKRGQNSPFPLTPTISSQQSILEPPPGVQYMDFVKTWTDDHISQWLTNVKCGNLAGTFKANDIRGDIILELDQVTLKEMGINSVGERLRIVNAVKLLRQRVSSRTVSTPLLDRSKPPPYTPELRTPQPDRVPTEPIRTETAPTGRLARSGRPAPLQLNPNASRSEQLPRLEPDSARSQTTMAPPPVRPLPNPTQQPGSTATTPSVSHTIIPAASRTHLPPLPPPPTSKPPPPPSRPTPRPSNSSLNGRRTPTQGELTPSYVSQNSTQNRDLLTPSPAGGWSGYHLPADPRQANSGGSKLAPPRATSPLPPGRVRPAASNSNLAHVRNTSLGVNSPVRGSSSAQQLPPRPSTGNSHPYANAANAQPSVQQNLSPIAESFVGQRQNGHGTPSPPNFPGSRAGASMDPYRHKLVKFILPDEGQAFTIDIATCAGGVEILEKVLKKFGKTSGRGNGDGHRAIEMEDGGLNINGWCVCLGMGQENGPGTPLREAELMSICNAPVDNPTREHGLILRRVTTTRRYEDRGESSSQGQNKSNSQTSRNTKRASSISVLSGLGVRDPEKALDPPSPTASNASKNNPEVKRPSKLRNFFGQRPPSELITNHLAEYFPAIEKKVLERTARQSIMMRGNPLNKRESAISVSTMPRSRFSSSTMGSSGSRNRVSMAPSGRSTSPGRAPSTISNNSLTVPGQEEMEPAPRVSLSTDDGREFEVDLNGKEEPPTPSRATAPQLLPPIHTDASFSSSFDDLTKMTQPNANRRMSYMTELRSKRDNSDAASFMTVDEITEQVESRRASLKPDDMEEWTKIEESDTSTAIESETLAESPTSTLEDNKEDSDEDDEPEAFSLGGLGGGGKWIKGALIGAGSFGKVYLGMDASNGMLMAVKQVELPTGSGPNQDKKKNMLNALEREIELLQNLEHPNIVQYLYSSIDDEFLNIFLEYVPGGSVTALLRSYGAFEEPLVKNFVRQILMGLNYLHEKDIIHRDIKGANVLVDNRGGIKISDFGISKKVDDNLLTGNRVNRPSLQGSVFWMAPEVVKQSAHTQKADIWSVGCLIVEMLTGEHPWAQLTQMQAIFKIGSSARPTIPPDISAEAQDFLKLTFELNHEARPSASQLMQHAWMQKKKKETSKTIP